MTDERVLSEDVGAEPHLETGAPHGRHTRQPVAPAHDRRHDDAQLRASNARGLHPRRQGICWLPRPIAERGKLRGGAALPAASRLERRRRADRQSRPDGPALSLHSDAAQTCGGGSAAFHQGAAEAAGRAEPGRGGASLGCRARSQVQGCPERGLRRGIARVRGHLAQGLRHRQRLHGHPGRARQGAQGRYVMLSPHLLVLLRARWKLARPQGWLFPGQNRVQPGTLPGQPCAFAGGAPSRSSALPRAGAALTLGRQWRTWHTFCSNSSTV